MMVRALAAGLMALCLVSACSSNDRPATGPAEADKLLLERGTAALKERRWATARQYFSELLENYPQSPLRADAKLGVGDSYLGEGNSASYVYAQNEYREFLAFYPTSSRADYAQLQLAMVHFEQMLNPQRDQTATREAIRELENFLQRYPNSPLIETARQRLQEAKDRLADHHLQIGRFYLSIRAYASAEPRYREILEMHPEYTRRDALYFYLAETLEKWGREVEALPYYERLVKEFEKSEFLQEARRRIERLKAAAASRAPSESVRDVR